MEEIKHIEASGLLLPEAFLARMQDMLGEDYSAFCASFAREAVPSLRVNPLKCPPEQASELIPYLGKPVPWQSAGFYYGETALTGEMRPGKHPFHEAGLYYIQEASAMLPGSLCPPSPGMRVLDLCAAPGGKATQLAGALAGEGVLIANEIHKGRAAILSQNMERLGVRNAVVTSAAPDELAAHFRGFFDLIVVDAPCSGEGMFRREADAVTMWSPENVALCANRQADILDAAAEMLAPGGRMVYSTCTFAPAENEGTVTAFLERHPDFTVIPSAEPLVIKALEAGLLDGGVPAWIGDPEDIPADIRESVRRTYRVLPHHTMGEGHYAALLMYQQEDHPAPSEKPRRTGKKSKGNKEKSDAAETAFKLFDDFCHEVFGGLPNWVAKAVPYLAQERLYLVPASLGRAELTTASDIREALHDLHVLRAGVRAGTVMGLERGRLRFEPDHALAMAMDVAPETLPTGYFKIETEELAVAYLRGETLSAPGVRGWRVMTYRGLPLGWGKASDGIMKNHYPKGLRWN